MPVRKPTENPKPPKHLRPATRRWFAHVCSEFALEQHHFRLLSLAAEAWDRGEMAREALEKEGALTFLDRFGSPHARPEVAIERDARVAFARLVRELDLDTEATPAASRSPGLRSNRSRRS